MHFIAGAVAVHVAAGAAAGREAVELAVGGAGAAAGSGQAQTYLSTGEQRDQRNYGVMREGTRCTHCVEKLAVILNSTRNRAIDVSDGKHSHNVRGRMTIVINDPVSERS
jgi:hypothetical protein